MAVLVTGGARSGKSRFAENYAYHQGSEGIYIATSQVYDDEMRERVDRHQARREEASFRWTTVEEPYDLAETLREHSGRIVLADCLTLWLTNWLLRCEQEAEPEAMVLAKIDELAATIADTDSSVILVTNEVGDGIVPEYPLGRQFRDLAGLMNQRVAAVCSEVFLVTAGIPIELKSLAYRFDSSSGDRPEISRATSIDPGPGRSE